ncbi:MAG TPA: hypothetical protein K8V61_11390 [Bacteroides clarus]|uniref:hypothetical protein n=1 Tax=Bacteroides clarus TaxID=626929 RepID=UPI001DF8899F|nr:hypothetical protein [Bacteroides clarus]HJF99875.1 hypothetical protein [Bacteroides clarus]
MNKGAQIVSASIIGADFVNVMVNGRCYTVFPPTVHKLAGAGMFLSDFGDEQTVRDVISSINDSEKLAHAFSWLVQGNDGLFDELSHGTFDELVDAIDTAYSLISVENFTRLSTLVKNVASLIAKQR